MNSKSHLFSIILLTSFTLCLRILAEPRYAERSLLVKWRDGPETYAAAVGNSQIGSTVKRNFNEIGWQLVELPPGLSVRDAMEAYQQLGGVLAVEPDFAVQAIIPPRGSSGAAPAAERGLQPVSPGDLPAADTAETGTLAGPTLKRTVARSPQRKSPRLQSTTPNDPMFGQQWYLKKISATNAWAVTTGSTNVVVAIIDSGVDYTHPDLAPNMWRNPGETGLDAQGRDKATNGIDDDDNGYVDDVHGADVQNGTGDPMDSGIWFPPATDVNYHGTGKAGIIGAVGNNSLGICGLNWSAEIMAIRWGVNDDNQFGVGPRAYWSDNLAAWDYILKMKRRGVNIRVTNNSYSQAGVESAAVREAIEMAGEEGILSVCAAAGPAIMTDLYPFFPGSFNLESVINVQVSTASDTLPEFANYGPGTVHLAAPGIDILQTSKGDAYTNRTGSSSAVPQVAGAAALLLSGNPNLNVDQLKAALFASVDQPSAMKGKLFTNGRLNVARALEYLTNPNPPAIVIYAAPAGQRTLTNEPIQVTFNRPMNRASV